jgi:hypothetical protein
MENLTYSLCALAALLCAVLLLRAYVRTRARLLLWSGLCFVGLTLNNALLVVDRILVPDADLSLWRHATALLAITLLIAGLILEPDQ